MFALCFDAVTYVTWFGFLGRYFSAKKILFLSLRFVLEHYNGWIDWFEKRDEGIQVFVWTTSGFWFEFEIPWGFRYRVPRYRDNGRWIQRIFSFCNHHLFQSVSQSVAFQSVSQSNVFVNKYGRKKLYFQVLLNWLHEKT